MKQVALVPFDIVSEARRPPPLLPKTIDKRHVPWCRCCGFQIASGEVALRVDTQWDPYDEWDDPYVEVVWIHQAHCRWGAAHELIRTGRSYRTETATLDEADVTLLHLYADGRSPCQAARRLGTTPASAERALWRLAQDLRLASERHARAIAADLRVIETASQPNPDEVLEQLIRELTS